MRVISSQRHLDEAIVAEKRAAKDYAVQFVEIEVEGEEFRVVVDGHHSLAAAKVDGAEPEWERSILQSEANHLGAERFLMDQHHGDDYYDVHTGLLVWQ